MSKIILNEKIAKNIFDDNAFRNELISALNILIDEELAKQDAEINFELVDTYTQALNRIYQNESIDKIFISLQSVREMRDFINSDTRFTLLKRSLKVTAAACALIAVTLGANFVAEKKTGYDFIEKMAQAVRTVFTGELKTDNQDPTTTTEEYTTEKTTQPLTTEPATRENAENVGSEAVTSVKPLQQGGNAQATTEPSTTKPHITPQNPNLSQVLSPEEPPTRETARPTTREPFTRTPEQESLTNAPVLIKLVGEFDSSFKRNYTVGESADFSGLTVKAVYDNGTQQVIPISNCNVYGFSTASPANRIVTVEYGGCSFNFMIRVTGEE